MPVKSYPWEWVTLEISLWNTVQTIRALFYSEAVSQKSGLHLTFLHYQALILII